MCSCVFNYAFLNKFLARLKEKLAADRRKAKGTTARKATKTCSEKSGIGSPSNGFYKFPMVSMVLFFMVSQSFT